MDRFLLSWESYSVAFALAFAGLISLAAPQLWLLWLLAAFGIRAAIPNKPPAEVQRRRQLVKDLEATFSLTKQEFQKVASAERFEVARKQLRDLRTAYDALPAEYQRNMATLQSQVRDAQMRTHLGQFSIRSAKIAGVGDSRKELLRSFGIDTAADINAGAISQVKGFGPKLVSAMLAWRHSKELAFVFDPRRGVDPQDIARLNRDTEAKTRRLEADIRSQANALQQLAKEIDMQRRRLLPRLSELMHALAQARADQ